MLKYEKITFLARKVAPKPEEVSFWIDISADPYGRIWKYWDGDDWQPLSMGGSGGAVDAYSKAEADLRFATASTLQQVADDVTNKQDTLVSGVNIRTINSQSVLGSGDIRIDVGLTQSQVESIVNSKVSGLVDSAPTTLDTLKEIATALNNDPAFATTITTLIGLKVNTVDYESDKANLATKSELANKADTSELSKYITTEAADAKYALKGESGDIDLSDYLTTDDAASTYATKTELSTKADETDLQGKQDTLVSGTNIKTINSQSILGTGNIEIVGSDGGITDAPSDSKLYGRQNGVWAEVPTVDTSSFATQEALTTGLASKVDTATYTDDKATFALKSEIPDTSNLATKDELDKLDAFVLDITSLPTEEDNLVITQDIYDDLDLAYLNNKRIYINQIPISSVLKLPSGSFNLRLFENLVLNSTASGQDEGFQVFFSNLQVSKSELRIKQLASYKLVHAEGGDGTKFLSNSGSYSEIPLHTYATKTELLAKQDTLVSGTNIKTVNGQSLLGSGDVTITGSGDVDLSDYVTTSTLTTTLASYVQLTAIADMETKTNAAATYQPKGDYATTSDLTSKLDTSIYNTDKATFALKTELPDISTKQDTLVSGTNIKTVNGQSLLGSGDIVIESGQAPDLSSYVTNDSLTTTLATYATKAEIPSVVLSSSYAASTATAPVANDTYEQAIAKLHAYINQLEAKVNELEAALTIQTAEYNQFG